jgi:hypothetical protein
MLQVSVLLVAMGPAAQQTNMLLSVNYAAAKVAKWSIRTAQRCYHDSNVLPQCYQHGAHAEQQQQKQRQEK